MTHQGSREQPGNHQLASELVVLAAAPDPPLPAAPVGAVHSFIGLIHLHNQTVRVHSEEFLHSELGHGLQIRNEEILIL